ncbi:DUF7601 domain-containing protein [Butyrivibrio sp. AE2032]|uniref:DUF7601 domain-containing protein n=1 Tax=Butyrivibrio sp. AE2032 TaxID=1458463 RepID=UPI000559139A|nr:FctA domain-containing protein [Butyrivibrio sp. AE2032]
MKKTTKLLSAALVTTLIAGVLALPAAAAGTNYTPVSAQNTSFDKYLLVKDGEKAPAVTFTYGFAAGTAIPATASTIQVYPGVGTPTASVSFTASDAAETTSLNANYTTYKKTVDVDFSRITFTEPGVYRYIITENNNAAAGIVYDVDPTNPTTASGDRTRTLDVYVEDDQSTTDKDHKNLIVTSYVMYNGTVTSAPPSATTGTQGAALTAATPVQDPAAPQANVAGGATKTNRIVNYFDSYTITFGKEVTGNQGSRDKYFDFTLTLTSPVTETAKVTFHNADGTVAAGVNDATTVSGTNVQTIDLTANTAVVTHFYLQDGQYITVSGLAVNTEYALAEAAEDYTSTQGIVQTLSSLNWDGTDGFDALTDSVNGTITNANIHTGFTNDKQGIIPTGVLLKIAPVAGIAFVVVAGVIFFAVMSVKRRESEELETENQ